MKIAILNFGNFLEHSSHIAKALSEHHEVHFFCPPAVTHLVKDFFGIRVNLIETRKYRIRDPRNLLVLWGIFRKLEHLEPDVVNIHSGDVWLYFATRLFLFRYPTVINVHDPQVHTGDEDLLKVGFKRFLPRAMNHVISAIVKKSDQVIVHGYSLRRDVQKIGVPDSRIHVIYRGEYSIWKRSGSEPREERNHALFFGRIVKYKGIEFLIDAAPLITSAVDGAKIVIAGRGDQIEGYRARMRSPDDFVVINEFVPYDGIQTLFEESRVVVLPYTEATQSAVLSLAYAFEKPVVVTNVGGLPEMVRDGRTGFVVEPGDVEGLAAAVIRVLSDEGLRERMKAEIREMKATTLSWASIALETEKVFRLAMSSHKRR